MKNQLKFYILFILCLVLIPSTVSAHTVTIGKATQNNNRNEFPVTMKAEGDITAGETIALSCDTGNTNTSCDVSIKGNGISSQGAITQTITSGTEMQIATITIINSSSSTSSGTVTLTGHVGAASVKTNTSFTVNAKPALKTNSRLNSLKISQGSMYPAFNQDITEYTIYNIQDTINSITLTYTCDDCSVSLGSHDEGIGIEGNGPKRITGIKQGNNNVELKVIAQDGEKNTTYKFVVIRGETEYNSARITALTLGDLEINPSFKEDILEYSVSVPYSTKDLNTLLNVTTKDEKAEVEITGADKLVEGENTVTIKVTSVNKDNTLTYTLKVTRLSSDDIILISYANGKITFKDAEGEKKTLTEEEFEKEYPTVWKDIKAKKYKFDEEGNLITDEDKKEAKKKDNKGLIIAIIAIVAVIIIGASGYFLFRKKDPEKEAKKKEEKIKKKAEKKARKDRLKKMEEEYYNEYYGEDDEYEDEYEDEEESDVDKKEETEDSEEVDEVEDKEEKNKKVDKGSLVDDDYLFESSLVEEENEEDEEEDTRSKRHKDDVVDIDSALEDLMNTKTYDFSDELKDVRDINEDEDEDE